MAACRLQGTVPLCAHFDTIGPLARTVEDCALILALLEGRKADPAALPLSGLRLGVLETVALDDLRDAPAKGFDDALARLARAGARITRIAAAEVTEAMALAGTLFTAEAYGTWSRVIEASPGKMFPRILERFRTGGTVKAMDYVAGWQRLDDLRRSFAAATAGVDALLVPTSPILPPDANRLMTDQAYYVTENLLSLRNTRIGNLMDQCVLTLPTSQPSCGISLMCPPGQEERLLRIGLAAERALI